MQRVKCEVVKGLKKLKIKNLSNRNTIADCLTATPWIFRFFSWRNAHLSMDRGIWFFFNNFMSIHKDSPWLCLICLYRLKRTDSLSVTLHLTFHVCMQCVCVCTQARVHTHIIWLFLKLETVIIQSHSTQSGQPLS